MTEMLIHMDLAGRRLVEFPAVLEVRLLGESKMKIARTIGGHLGLLAWTLARRLRSAGHIQSEPVGSERGLKKERGVTL